MNKRMQRLAVARMTAEKFSGHLRAKGFRPDGDLQFTRVDADLYYSVELKTWIVKVWTTEGRQRLEVLTVRHNPILLSLLKSFF